MREHVEVTIAGQAVNVTIGTRLCREIERVSGESSFIDPLDRFISSIQSSKPNMTAADVLVKAAARAAGLSESIADDVPFKECIEAASTVALAIARSLRPEDDKPSPPVEAAAGSSPVAA